MKSIIIPAYNEERRIKRTIENLIDGFPGQEIIVVCDADESVSIDDLKGMFQALHGVDGVIASRRLKRSKILIKQPIQRRLASRIFNIFVRMLFSLPYEDTQ